MAAGKNTQVSGWQDPFRNVASPLTAAMLAPVPPHVKRLQFSGPLALDDFAVLGRFLEDYPRVGLRAYGNYDGSIRDLEFLRFFPTLMRFEADAIWKLDDISGLRFLPDELRILGLGRTKRRLSLQELSRFRKLTTLYLEGQTKDIEVLSGMTELEDLTLRSITLPSLEILLPMEKLRSLDIKLGGTTNLQALPRVGKLKYLELWMVNRLADLSVVGEVTSLEYLFLQALRQVKELPDLTGMSKLYRVHIETLKGLSDLRPLRDAPALEELLLVDMRHLTIADLEPLVQHRTLKRAAIGLGSTRRNQVARELLGVPDVGLPREVVHD